MEIKITHKRDMSHTYIQFNGGTIAAETYPVQILMHGLVDGILPCSLYAVDNQQIWCCENTSKQPLSTFCENRNLSGKDLVWIFGGLLQILKNMQDYLLEVNWAYLKPEELYLDLESQKIYCCIVPIHDEDIWQALYSLSHFFLGCLDQHDSQAITMAYGIFRYLANGGCRMDELWALIFGTTETEKTEDMEIPDYQQAYARTNSPQIPPEEPPIIDHKDVQRQRDLDSFFSGESDEELIRKADTENSFIWLLWIGPITLAIFLSGYLLFNFWHLNFFTRIVLFTLVTILTIFAFISWWKIGRKLDEEETEEGWMALEKNYKKQNSPRETAPEGTTLLSPEPSSAAACLIHQDTHEKILLDKPIMFLGKQPGDVDILRPEPVISRIHAKIIKSKNAYQLEDLNSKNGTYINGRILSKHQRVKLKNGDMVSFANIPFIFKGK